MSITKDSVDEQARVRQELLRLDPAGTRTASVVRYTFDQLLDGSRTGRWDFSQLHKTEKTHMGTLVEINMHREFDFEDGDDTDYRIAGIEVDCKFSQSLRGWMFGPEMIGHLCLVIWASDLESVWQAGIVRASLEILGPPNRDQKRRLVADALPAVEWLWGTGNVLEENLLLHLPATVRDEIMLATNDHGRRTGTARLNQLCRAVQGRILNRTVVETVGHGLDDPLKRMRGNGGARQWLQPEGIVVLGHQDNDPYVAEALGLPVPHKGEFVAARVYPADAEAVGPVAVIGGEPWRIARGDDGSMAAPDIPRR